MKPSKSWVKENIKDAECRAFWLSYLDAVPVRKGRVGQECVCNGRRS